MLALALALLLFVAPTRSIYEDLMERLGVPAKIYACYFCVGFWIAVGFALAKADIWVFAPCWVSICLGVPLIDQLKPREP